MGPIFVPPSHESPQDRSLADLTAQCMDSQGYLFFVAYLKDSGEKVEFQYRRHHFSLEDSKKALLALKGFVQEELEKLSLESGGPEEF